MKRSIAFTVVLLAFASARASEHPEHPKADAPPTTAAAAAGAGALDGRTFTGKLGKAGESAGDADTLTFDKGAFVSAACVPFGFQSTPYIAATSSEATTFTAKATNAKGETMEWTGTLRGQAIEATAVHRTGTGETETYWFKGTAGKAKAAAPPKKSEHPEHPK